MGRLLQDIGSLEQRRADGGLFADVAATARARLILNRSMSNNKYRANAARMIPTALAGSLLALSAWAQQAYFSGPSVTRLQQAAAFSGNGFKPNTALNIAVLTPAGATSVASAVSSASGALSYTLVPTLLGTYTLRVQDGSGNVLADAVVGVLAP